MPLLNLDTHILVHALTGDLRPAEEALLIEHDWGVAAIVFWELAKLSQLGRLDIDFAEAEIQSVLASLHVWPLDLKVARASIDLDFRGDPADELIAATSMVHAIPLLTRDRQILKSTRVPLSGSVIDME